MMKIFCFNLVIIFLVIHHSFAQVKITGRVTSQLGEVLPGANINVKGYAIGTTAGDSGIYILDVPNQDALLIFSFAGYLSQEIPIEGRKIIDVTLESDIKLLQEIVVVGFGTQKKINVTGAVSSIDASQISNRSVTNVTTLLTGQAAGVTILAPGGEPGNNSGSIRIRGIGTIGDGTTDNAKNSPLILVDGIETGSLTEIDPNDVANISILKDASASAIYGVRAANGVIIVTTKRGQAGAIKVNYNYQIGRSEAIMLPQKASSYELAVLNNEANKNAGGLQRFTFSDLNKFKDGSDPLVHPNDDRTSKVLNQPAVRQVHNLSFSGGSETFQFNTSFGYTHEGGLMLNTGLDRYTFRVNLDQKISSKLSVGLNIWGSQMSILDPIDGIGGTTGLLHDAYREWATDIAQYPDGRWAYPLYASSSGVYHNSVAYAHAHGNQTQVNTRLMGTFFAEYEIIKGLKLKGIAATIADFNKDTQIMRAIDLYNIDPLTEQISATPNPSQPATNSSILKGFYTNADLNLQLLLNYEKKIKNHYLKGLLGFNQRKITNEIADLSRRNLNPALDQINGASAAPTDLGATGNTTDYRLRSGFGRINYSFKERYLLEGNVRYDGTSRFPKQNRFQAFPSVSAGWRISEEKFFKVPFISLLKLRASWGKLGNQEIGDYAFINQVDLSSTSAIFGGTQVPGAIESTQLANPVVKWETTTSSDFAFDSELLDGKLLVTSDYFYRVTNDILLPVQQPAILGATAPVSNAGSVLNKGLELSITYRNRIGDFKYSINGNVTKLKNQITSLGGLSSETAGNFLYQNGKPISNIYGYKADGLFLNSSDVQNHANQLGLGGIAQAGDIKYRDLNHDGVIDRNDRMDLGTYFPVVNYGVSFNLSYKNFDFNMLWQGVYGTSAYITGALAQPFLLSSSPYKIQYNDRAQIDDNGQLLNPNAKFPRTLFSNPNNYTGSISQGLANSFFVKSSSFLKLRNVQIGYNLSAAALTKLHITKLRAYINCENLLTISPFNYYKIDPEISALTDPVPTYPTVRTFSAGLNLSF